MEDEALPEANDEKFLQFFINFLVIYSPFSSLLSLPFRSAPSCHEGVTTMLNFFTTSNGFRSTLPVVSNLTAMNIWDGVCMCFIYASLLEFVCVNYVGRKRPLHNVVYRPGENPVTQVNTSQHKSDSVYLSLSRYLLPHTKPFFVVSSRDTKY
jgi:hypothetical protein